MENRHVLVTYAAPTSFLSSDSWNHIHKGLLSQLPLRNLHWKSASRPSIRTIQELDVTLLPLDTVRDELTSQIPVTLLEKPLLNIYIVLCEDLETYRSTIKKQIKDWHVNVTQRRNQEWIILHVVRTDIRATAGGFFQVKGSVLDRIKADYNMDKRDRCVQLAWSSGHENPVAWADLVTKIKDGLLSAFDSIVAQREEEVKRSESQRQMPGWNFCTFFILKESLASTFEGVNLFEDALIQYDELEASFFQVLRDKNLSWFGTLITPTPKDDSSSLLSMTKKPYRDFILANTISVFDFRIYLLARQCALLAKMGRLIEVGRKASAFLGAFGRRLREIEATLPRFFIESWTYHSALSVVEQCESWASARGLENSELVTIGAVKGELLELARNQLDILGIRAEHLPSQPPFSMALPPASTASTDISQNRSSLKMSASDLISSLHDRDKFYDRYVSVTNRAIDMYAKGKRRKFALKLHGSLAALDVHRGRLAAGLQTYSSLPAHYAPHMWTSLESFMLSRAIETHARLEKPNDREWIHIVLSFLKAYVEGFGHELLIPEDDKVAYVTQLVNAVKNASDELDSDLAHPDHPAMFIRVSSIARTAETEDGSFLDVVVHNRLPCSLPVDQISVTLAGRDTERLIFMKRTNVLPPGTTSVTLFSATPSHGTYFLDSSEVRVSHLLLQWSHRKPVASGKSAQAIKDQYSVVHIPRDLRALDIRLRQPHYIELGTSSKLLVAVSTGRNFVSEASVTFSGPSGVHFKYSEAISYNDDVFIVQATNDHVSFSDVAPDKTITFLVPYSGASTSHAMTVHVDVEYETAAEPLTARAIRLARVVPTSLPVSVNVQDFFRGTRLLSKFTISTTSHQHVRIVSAQLENPGEEIRGVKVIGSIASKRGVVTVTPAQPANFLFYIDSADGPVRESLRLLIKYRMLREEVESLIHVSVDSVIRGQQSLLRKRDILVARLIDALESDASWVEMYSATGELNVPGLPDEPNEPDATLQQLKQILGTGQQLNPAADVWHEISIPVDVPYMNIVAAARINILPTPFSTQPALDALPALYAGQPISALLNITTSFHWGSSETTPMRTYTIRFDVEEIVRDWLVSGRKRGDFTATDGTTFTVPITLIALHHGELSLPKVAVTSLPLPGETMGSVIVPSIETHQVHGAEKVLVLPRGGRSTFTVGMGDGMH